jgi:NTE family protein
MHDPMATNPGPRRLEQRPPFERIALLLQGGGALGSYQAGVYQALAQANLHPDWVAGISIGAINAALIAGNQPANRVERLREFWELVSTPPLGIPHLRGLELDEITRRFVNQARAFGILLLGAPHFFEPRILPPIIGASHSAGEVSYYDVAPLKATLERLVEFDVLNSGTMHFSVGAVNVRTGNFIYFDNANHEITAAHVIASGSLPPGFPATEIEGEYYWDGGIVSNTPLQYVLDSRPREDTLAFQIDLWSAPGELPRDITEAEVRAKEIRFSSRTRAATDQYKYAQRLRIAFANLLKKLPDELREDPDVKALAAEADDKICNIVQLVHHSQSHAGIAKDYEFSRRTMEEHWQSGYADAVRSLSHPEIFQRPEKLLGVHTFDFSEFARKSTPGST